MRQLWWGHRIPAYYLSDGTFVVAETSEKALEEAMSMTGNSSLTLEDLHQDDASRGGKHHAHAHSVRAICVYQL